MTEHPAEQPAVEGFSSADVSDVHSMSYEQARTELIQTVERLEAGGTKAAAYADAIATYLGLGVSLGPPAWWAGLNGECSCDKGE